MSSSYFLCFAYKLSITKLLFRMHKYQSLKIVLLAFQYSLICSLDIQDGRLLCSGGKSYSIQPCLSLRLSLCHHETTQNVLNRFFATRLENLSVEQELIAFNYICILASEFIPRKIPLPQSQYIVITDHQDVVNIYPFLVTMWGKRVS